MFGYLKSLIGSKTQTSSKRFSLVVSVIIGAFICICIGFSILYDVFTNGFIKTDLDSVGVLILAVGGYIAGSGVNKAVADVKRTEDEQLPPPQYNYPHPHYHQYPNHSHHHLNKRDPDYYGHCEREVHPENM